MKKADLIFSIFLLFGAALLYTPSLGSGFVFDDEVVIAGDRSLRSLENLPDFFLQPAFSYYRPLRTLSYHLDYRYWGLNPFGYRLTSIFLHGLCCLAFFLLLKNLGAGFPVRAGAALIFLLHPIATEPVIYLSSRAELLGTLFGLLSFLAGARFFRSGKIGAALLALLFLAAAFFSKESFLVLPLLFLFLLRRDREAAPGNRRRNRALAGAAFLLAGAFAWFRFFFLRVPTGPDRFGKLLEYPQILIKMPEVFLTYLRLLLLPVGLSPHPPLAAAPLPSPPRLAAQLVLAGAAIILLAAAGLRKRRFLPGGAWFLLALLPVSNLYPLSRLMAEKYLYFPLAGLAWLAAELILGGGRRGLRLRTALFGTAAVFWLVLNLNRQPDWRDNYTLWGKTAARSAPHPLVFYNWGLARVRAGEVEEGLAELERADEMVPGHPAVREKIADALGILGRHREAFRIYRELLEEDPGSPALLIKAGFTYDVQGFSEPAEGYYRLALERAGADGPGREKRLHSVYLELAALQEALGEYGRAAGYLESAREIFPGDRELERKIAFLYGRDGQLDRAREIYGRLPGEELPEHLLLFLRGRKAERAGRFEEAARDFYEALKLDPAFAPAYFELGGVLAARREYEAAERFIAAGLNLQGDDFRHHTNLGTVRQLQGKYPEAAEAYLRSLELEESFIARYNLGFLYLNRLFDPESARPHLEAALRLRPDPEQRENLLRALERIDRPE